MFGIKSTRIVANHSVAPGILVIDRGRIQTIFPYHFEGLERVEDVGEAWVIPGLVDPHVHINEPGNTEWEGIASATKAAAAGGVTTLVDMPLNSIPVTTSVEALRQKVKAAQGQAMVDLSFWGGVVPGEVKNLDDLSAQGVPGFKTFMIDSGLPEFAASDEKTLRESMPIIAKNGLKLLAHAELDLGHKIAGSPAVYENFMNSRPQEWEYEAISLLIKLVRKTQCPVHIVHLAAASCLEMLAEARAEGLPITVETCPHYLVFSAEQIAAGQTQFKCCPPIRDAANREALWQGLRDGIIDMVTTDHSPCVPALKQKGGGDFGQAWGGIASLGLALPLIWTEAQKRGFEMTDIVKWMASDTARLASLDNLKGALQPGLLADVVVFDGDQEWTIGSESLYMRHPFTPFEGMKVKGRVLATYLSGEKVYSLQDGFPGAPNGKVRLIAPAK